MLVNQGEEKRKKKTKFCFCL